ncbi:LysR substrate-binding domain-containing protein [Neorhizobium sp. DAR64872/K0K18]|uniref:LysR substrate-binding domain-containing protein n=1 Tax=Neorhizobium sp. DAR64872/K0K18 TaxID=3421958 RepID=UPI003D29A291
MFLDRIAPLVAKLTDALVVQSASDDAIRGVLRLNTSFSAALYLLKEMIPAFRALHPLVELEIYHEERMVDIVASGCDAGIRLGRTVPGDMIGVSFGGPLQWIAVASPDYIARCGEPSHPNDLLNHECIRIRMPSGQRYSWEFSRGAEELVIDVAGAMTLDRMALMIEAALNGTGIAYVLKETVDDHLAAGRLQMLLPEWASDEDGYMLYYPGKRVPPAPLEAFVRHVRALEKA